MSSQPGLHLLDLRVRILKIAASYDGQSTYNKPSGGASDYVKYGFNDPIFEEKMRSIGWNNKEKPNLPSDNFSGKEWCNYTVNLVWSEAFAPGNSLVPSTQLYPGNYIFTPNRRTRMMSDKIKSALGTNYRIKTLEKYGMQDPGVGNTKRNFVAINRFIPIDFKQEKLKNAIEEQTILPGDAVIFGAEEHIGIYIGPVGTDGKKIWCIDGNTREDGPSIDDINIVRLNIKPVIWVNGFCQLFTSNDL